MVSPQDDSSLVTNTQKIKIKHRFQQSTFFRSEFAKGNKNIQFNMRWRKCHPVL